MAQIPQGIKLLEDKNVSSEINCMVLSNKMDLIAFSNAKGEVALHRLAWTRAWLLSPPIEGLKVCGIAWRPDGKVLAIAYSDGLVLLINIETKAILKKFNINGKKINFLSWVQEKPEPVSQTDIIQLKDGLEEDLAKFIDLSKPYLRDPPPVSHLDGAINFEDIKGLSSFLQEQSEFNLLIVGTEEGTIHINIFGCWTCLAMNINEKLGFKCLIQNIHFNEDFSKLFVAVTDGELNVKSVLFDTLIFKEHRTELYLVTMKYIKLYELLAYLSKILASITETWEGILLEFDKKLAKYATKVPEGGVTADFLELLMFGICSDEMEEFLLHDLTKKGLEKFGQTMEVSYSNIQSYLVRHIIKFAQNGTFHLSDLKGMAAFEDRFEIMGLDAELIQKSIQSNGAFVLKASEMQQIINHSVITYKAFFSWLYSTIMDVMEEPIPNDVPRITQQDLGFIAEFLQNFDNYGKINNMDGAETSKKFIMERVGQYLLDENLTIKPDMSGNDWSQFIEENECLKRNANLLTHYVEKSLIQVYNELDSDIQKIFESPISAIGKIINPIKSLTIFRAKEPSNKHIKVIVTSINIDANTQFFAFVHKSSKIIQIIEISYLDSTDDEQRAEFRCKSCNFVFRQENNEEFNIIDIQFYSANILTVLLEEKTASSQRNGIIYQLMIDQIMMEHFEEVDSSIALDEQKIPLINPWSIMPIKHYIKNTQMSCSKFSVSGTRKVCIILSENKRKIKLFETECEEEDDVEKMSTNTSVFKDESFNI